jgi:hypothetical protein
MKLNCVLVSIFRLNLWKKIFILALVLLTSSFVRKSVLAEHCYYACFYSGPYSGAFSLTVARPLQKNVRCLTVPVVGPSRMRIKTSRCELLLFL